MSAASSSSLVGQECWLAVWASMRARSVRSCMATLSMDMMVLPPAQDRAAGAGDALRRLRNGLEACHGNRATAGSTGAVGASLQPAEGRIDIVHPLPHLCHQGGDAVALDA